MVIEKIGEELRDKDDFKSEKDLGNLKSMVLISSPRKVKPKHRHTIIKERNIAGDILIWGSTTFGKWGSQKWGDTATYSFILGHSGAGILGTSKLGSNVSSWETTRVVNPNRKYIDNLLGTTFKDTSSTATWTGGGQITFTGGETASSLTIYMNNETVSSATLTAVDSGSIDYYLSADGGTNWEKVTSGISHTFTNQGTDLRWRATSTGSASISSIEIEY